MSKDVKVDSDIIEKSVTELRKLTDGMRKSTQAIRMLEKMSQVEKAVEVGPHSLIQVVECIEVQKGFIGWSFRQAWMDKLSIQEQEMVMGAYLGEKIGPFKIVGIYDPIPLKEESVRRSHE